MTIAAFVQPPSIIHHAGRHLASTSISSAASHLPTMAASAMTLRNNPSMATAALGMTASRAVMDPAIKVAAMSFFTGVRIPATLIAGSSLAALFTMTAKVRDTSGLSTTEILLLRLYHVLSLLSLCLSMTSVVTSTSAGTMLLLHKYQTPDPHIDVYRFLRECMDLEFCLTRFSFITSLMCFLSAVTGRIIIEFDLWTKKRRLAGFMVLSKMTAVLTLLLSYANTSLNCWENLFSMGVHVAQVCLSLAPFSSNGENLIMTAT